MGPVLEIGVLELAAGFSGTWGRIATVRPGRRHCSGWRLSVSMDRVPSMPVTVGERLSIQDVVAVANGEPAVLSPAARERMLAARDVVDRKVAAGETVYGVTTGLGSLANVRLEPDEVRRLQHDLLRSHAVGVGPPLAEREVRAMLLLRAHVLALGHSGVRPLVVERLLEFLEQGLLPVVPEQG